MNASDPKSRSVLASDLYHEVRHAGFDEEKVDALRAQLALLKRWRAEGVLSIADPYIAAKEEELRDLRDKNRHPQ